MVVAGTSHPYRLEPLAMTALAEATHVMRIHRDIYPDTDHGYTWVECYWFEVNGERVSPFIPGSGSTERLGSMPGPIHSDPWQDCKHYLGDHAADSPMVRSETVHSGRHKVGPVCIVPA